MALDTDLLNQATKIKAAIVAISDLGLDSNAIYIHQDAQDFDVPACSIALVSTRLIRLNESQGRWESNWLVEIHHNPMSEPERGQQGLKLLATIMKGLISKPTLDGMSITTEATEGASEISGSTQRDQGVETLGFLLGVVDEPVSIPTGL